MTDDYTYSNSLTSYSRFKTRVIAVGNVPMGGHFPVRIQSMTNTNTLDTMATVEQTIKLAEAGCEYVRITAQSIKETENLARIRKELRNRGYEIPLIADIHFNPAIAEIAARIVEKIRINPGNYIDKKKFKKIDYSDYEYNKEIDKIIERISPLIKICREYGTAIRIGTNHGSLSDRIVSRYGDTPFGMVESAVEFVKICESLGFGNIVLSMKASNIKIMIEAYRLLVHRMLKENMNYPLHLGVTEAGSGEEGRIKSAAGIGTLLEDGIGDTIRVSLTENPEAEIPVAKALIKRYSVENKLASKTYDNGASPVNPFEYKRRYTNEVLNIGKDNEPVVIISAAQTKSKTQSKADYIFCTEHQLLNKLTNTTYITNAENWDKTQNNIYPLFPAKKYFRARKKSALVNFVVASHEDISKDFIKKIENDNTIVLIIESDYPESSTKIRNLFFLLLHLHCKTPVIIKRNYSSINTGEFQLYAATDAALLLTDGLGDGLWFEAEGIETDIIEKTAFDILQATGVRIYKTEYVSCPTCGRTSYDILETVEQIKQYTAHLKGLKIAVMGCIVNGPGEMADADYGYVGCGEGKINLYKGKTLVRHNIEEKNALNALISLIKENGDWLEEE